MRRAFWLCSAGAVVLIVVQSLTTISVAWGEDGHRYLNLVAAQKLPDDMPGFLKAAAVRLSFLGPEPDRWRDSTMLGAVTGPDHFVDIDRPEDFDALPGDRYQYSEWLRGKGKDPKVIGFVPYSIVEGYEKVRVLFHLWRDPKRESERDQIEQNIVYYAGTMGHFVADGSQPLHCTIHYNGWTTSSNPDGFTREPLHGRFESEYVKANVRPEDFSGLVKRAEPIKDILAETMRFLVESHGQVRELYMLEKRVRWDAANKNPESKKFVEARLAVGAQMLSNLWYTAWLNSKVGRQTR
jgi:hypothetical protein